VGLKNNARNALSYAQPSAKTVAPRGEQQPKEPNPMLRGKSSLFAIVAAFVVAAAWSGIGMAADAITPENVGTQATSAKSAQDYQALADYYAAQAKAAKEQADQVKAQYDAIHAAKGKRTGSDAEVIDTQRIFMKRARAHYLALAEQDSKLAAMYAKLAKSAGGGATAGQ
jgi:hypothetical protein